MIVNTDTARRVPTTVNETFVQNRSERRPRRSQKRYRYINLKFGQPFYPNNPIFSLELPAAASPQIIV